MQSLAIAVRCGPMSAPDELAAAVRQIARGLDALADALAGDSQHPPELRELEILREWGERGLTRSQASALFRKYGLAPQTAGGWARGDWIETRDDGRRYITERSRRWVAEQEVADRLEVDKDG